MRTRVTPLCEPLGATKRIGKRIEPRTQRPERCFREPDPWWLLGSLGQIRPLTCGDIGQPWLGSGDESQPLAAPPRPLTLGSSGLGQVPVDP
jgi:hypothetical protein